MGPWSSWGRKYLVAAARQAHLIWHKDAAGEGAPDPVVGKGHSLVHEGCWVSPCAREGDLLQHAAPVLCGQVHLHIRVQAWLQLGHRMARDTSQWESATHQSGSSKHGETAKMPHNCKQAMVASRCSAVTTILWSEKHQWALQVQVAGGLACMY